MAVFGRNPLVLNSACGLGGGQSLCCYPQFCFIISSDSGARYKSQEWIAINMTMWTTLSHHQTQEVELEPGRREW